MSSGAWRRRLPAAALSMLLAVALTLAGAVHALPPQGSATPSSDSISRAEAFVPWICGPGTSTEQQAPAPGGVEQGRSEEHTSELQSLMRNSYAVFCLKKKNRIRHTTQ